MPKRGQPGSLPEPTPMKDHFRPYSIIASFLAAICVLSMDSQYGCQSDRLLQARLFVTLTSGDSFTVCSSNDGCVNTYLICKGYCHPALTAYLGHKLLGELLQSCAGIEGNKSGCFVFHFPESKDFLPRGPRNMIHEAIHSPA